MDSILHIEKTIKNEIVNGENKAVPMWCCRDESGRDIAVLIFHSTAFEGDITFPIEEELAQSKKGRKIMLRAIKKLIKTAHKKKTIEAVIRATRNKSEKIRIAGKREERMMILDEMDIMFATANEVFADDIDKAGIGWFAEDEKGVGIEAMNGIVTYYFSQNAKRYLSSVEKQ